MSQPLGLCLDFALGLRPLAHRSCLGLHSLFFMLLLPLSHLPGFLSGYPLSVEPPGIFFPVSPRWFRQGPGSADAPAPILPVASVLLVQPPRQSGEAQDTKGRLHVYHWPCQQVLPRAAGSALS